MGTYGGDIVIIGGGASGMAAAAFVNIDETGARQNQSSVTILEKNNILGRKLRITGKGRCNLTNACGVREMLTKIPGNPAFLYSSLYGFDSAATIEFFNGLGVATKIERGDRVFPVSDKADDVADALVKKITDHNIHIRLNTAARSIIIKNGAVAGVALNTGETLRAGRVLIAAGGSSYPRTGSNGDGCRLAKQAGHSVATPRPSLVPLTVAERWVGELEGLTLKNVKLTAHVKNTGNDTFDNKSNKILYADSGEMLFTSRGVSGPLVLSASRFVTDALDKNETLGLNIDLKPGLDGPTLDKRLLRDFEMYKNKDFINALNDLLPKSLIPVIVKLSGIPEHKKVHGITRGDRSALNSQIKNLTLTITGTEGFEQAVTTRGGVNVKEIDPSTMESKIVKGLYFSGEVIDVDALTGGFNLQIAFSTGALAGKCMGRA